MKKFVAFEYIKQLLGISSEVPKSVDLTMKPANSKKKSPKKPRGRGKK